MNNISPTPRTSSLSSHKALWLIGAGLLANAAVLLYGQLAHHAVDFSLDRTAFAQTAPPSQMLGARGIFMMPAQLGPQSYGLYLMDVDAGTICVYRTNPENSRLRLMAARSFKNDSFLEDYNNEPPVPRDVQKWVATQRQRTQLESQTNQPTVDQTPKPDENAPDAPAK